MGDRNLIQKIADGDLSAFKELFENYKNAVFNLCFRFTRSREEAEDLCQDVFLKIYHSAKKFRSQSHPSTWIYRITVNLCLNHNRKKNRYFLASLEDDDNSIVISNNALHNAENDPHTQLEKWEREKLVQNAIQSLPERQRVAFILQRYQGFSIKEIAEIMNCSELSVQSRLARARENLAKKLLPLIKNL